MNAPYDHGARTRMDSRSHAMPRQTASWMGLVAMLK